VAEATRLLEQLLEDPEFRARFRSDPAGTARAAGVELDAAGDALQTLDGRESKSSFAGALMAAALEGVALYELGQHVLPGVEDAQAASTGWDPDQFGQAGAGGTPTPDSLELLRNPNVSFDPDGVADLKAGRVDPRVVSVLDSVAQKHKISISAVASDHSRLTTGGSVSNHYYGRAVDISMVDGRPVGPGNLAARQVAVALSQLPAGIRPSEIGSPWSLPGAAYFTDGAHQNHLHVAFDDPIKPGWSPPGGGADPPDAPDPDDSDDEDDAVPTAAEQRARDAAAASSIVRQAAAPPVDPDDLEGNLDDEDAGEDEEDGSNEDEADEGGGEDDDGPSESDDGDEEEEDEGGGGDEDEGQDEPGEGSNGEDATDDNDDSDDEDSDDGGNAPDAQDTPETPIDAASDYPGDGAPREQIAAWMGAAAEKRGIPAELPVMAGLTESSLRNLHYGDADSIGFFQMRTSIWDQGEYAGYGKQPEKQLDWFLDRAEAVKAQRVSRGQQVDDPSQYGEWIADVERPAEQYRGRYQLRLEEARKLLGRR
jgi:hypothetical protein